MPVNFVKLYTNLERKEIAWKSWEKGAKKGLLFQKAGCKRLLNYFVKKY